LSRRINIAVDLVAFVGFLVAGLPATTGALNHERIGIAISATMVVHLLLHRAWVASVARRFIGTVAAASRVNFLVDGLMGVAAATIAVTGVMLSRTLLAPLGLSAARGGTVLVVHGGAAEVLAVLVVAHLVLHRVWIGRAFASMARAAVSPFVAPLRRGAPVRVAVPVPADRPKRALSRGR
jgi:hypothetical protein